MVISNQEALKTRLKKVRERIRISALDSGRNPDDIDLVVVTKTQSAAVIKNLFDLGITKIGESYLNEAVFKVDILKDFEIDWHMIGSIQLGKVKQIIYNFNCIHSVDRQSLAAELQKRADQLSRNIHVYLELNVSGETTKHGWDVRNEKDYPKLLGDVEQILKMPALTVMGLMTMAPYSPNPENSRPYFRKLRDIRDLLVDEFPGDNINGLSMGMSGDFEIAVQEGATILRVGSAIVGDRQG